MSNISEYKNRLHAVKQTRQITGAMYLLSTSRMKKAMQNIDFNLTYLKRLRGTIKDILSKTKHNDIHNRYIEEQGDGAVMFIVVSSDKGLCGSFNSDIADTAIEQIQECDNTVVLSLGSVGSSMLRAKGVNPDYSWDGALQHPNLIMADYITESLMQLYREHEVCEARVIYTEYKNPSVQTVVTRRLLPLLRRDFLDIEYEYKYTAYPIYEPDVETVFDSLVRQYVSGFMYDVFMQSAASENSARMKAMQSATDNADEMIADLSAKLNAARQLAITNEIIEITAASDVSGAV